MNINIKTIPHSKQRYNTVGDYDSVDINCGVNISISGLRNWKYELLVAVHELIELSLCYHRDIPEEIITKFDMDFEKAREETSLLQGEPGDAAGCPYRKEHFFATSIERLLAAELGVDWEKYEKTINDL